MAKRQTDSQHFSSGFCLRRAAAYLIVAFLSAGLAFAQALSGVVGTVTDTSGAVVEGADVTAINNATGIKSHAVTSAVGAYFITDLIPGTYTVTVDKNGFTTASTRGVTVEAGGMKSTVNAVLKVGSVSQTVSVEAPPISLETDNAEIGTTVEHDLIEETPIEFGGSAAGSGSTPRGRRIDAFLTLTPGVSGSNGFYRINGGQDFSSAVAFNGVPMTFSENPGDTEYLNPPFEMVNQARVVSASSGPESGLGQGTASYGFRSGTNVLQGSVFEIMRNSSLDARGAYPEGFAPPPGPIPTPEDHENNFGFSLGGPVFIPHVYNGKSKTFFQLDVEWYYFHQACVDCLGTVPTDLMRSGDFSQNWITCTPGPGDPSQGQPPCPANGQQTVPIFVPAAWYGHPSSEPSGCPIVPTNPANGPQQFPGNKIPSGCFSPLSQAFLELIPHATVNGPNPNTSNILTQIPSYPAKNNKWGFSIDHNLTEKQRIHGSYWRSPFSVLWANSYNLAITNPLATLSYQRTLGSGLVLNYSYAISNRLVMTVGASWMENSNDWSSVPAAENGSFSALAQLPQGTPGLNFDGSGPNAPTGVGLLYGAAYQPRHNKGLTIENSWIYSEGHHTITIGGEFRHSTQHQRCDGKICQNPGIFNFNSDTTSDDLQNPDGSGYSINNTGSSFASFLLGDVDTAGRSVNGESKLGNFDYSPYVQDQIKPTPKLTVNLGLRWDIAIPFTSNTSNPAAQIDFFQTTVTNPGAISTTTGKPLSGAYSALGTCSYCVGYDRANIHWRHFAPSVGLAYQLNQKTVLRSGFSQTFLPGGAYNYGDTGVPNYYSGLLGGFLNPATYSNQGWPGAGLGTWDNNPLLPLPSPPPTPFSPSICNGVVSSQCTEMFSKDPGAYPYTMSWSAGIQREIPWQMFLTISYVANRGVHLGSLLNPINQLDPALLSKFCPGGVTPGYGGQCVLGDTWNDTSPGGAQSQLALTGLLGQDTNGLYSPYQNFFNDYGGANTGTTLFQALLPYPQVNGTAYNGFENEGKSRYNSLQTQLERRLSDGVSILANYTLSRNMGNAETARTGTIGVSAVNKYDQGPEYAITSFDETHVINITGVYQFPFGPGTSFLNNGGKVMKNLIGGWQLSGILTYNSGTPYGIGAYGSPLGGGNRADIVPGVKPYIGSRHNTNKCAAGTSGNGCQPLPILNPAAFSEPGPWVVGTSPRQLSYLRVPWTENENVALAKKLFLGERLHAEFRVEFFNLLNRVVAACGPQDTTAGDSNFGLAQLGCQSNTRREGQAFFRVQF